MDVRQQLALQNMQRLRDNPYPGRGFVIGKGEDGRIIFIYYLSGRSAGSRNRVFKHEDSLVYTAIKDPTIPVGDPALTIYNAMRSQGRNHVVSNGNQTDKVIELLHQETSFDLAQVNFKDSLADVTYEPDSNFTPRITGLCKMIGATWQFHISVITKRAGSGLKSCSLEDREALFYRYDEADIPAGYGRMVHTYLGDGNPLPSFSGEPLLVPLHGTTEVIHEQYWNALNKENRVAIVTRAISRWNNGTQQIEITNK